MPYARVENVRKEEVTSQQTMRAKAECMQAPESAEQTHGGVIYTRVKENVLPVGSFVRLVFHCVHRLGVDPSYDGRRKVAVLTNRSNNSVVRAKGIVVWKQATVVTPRL